MLGQIQKEKQELDQLIKEEIELKEGGDQNIDDKQPEKQED